MAVFVLDRRKKPLMSCSEKRARLLLERGRARVHRLHPFTIRLGIPKGHALDAACVGEVDAVLGWQQPVLQIKATGRGSYQRTRLDRHGFPRGYLLRRKQVKGFQTGDRVKAIVPTGKHAGTHVGRVAIRASGSFNLQTPTGLVQGIHHRHCRVIQRADGYGYSWAKIAPTQGAGTGAAYAAALSLPGLNAGVSRADGRSGSRVRRPAYQRF